MVIHWSGGRVQSISYQFMLPHETSGSFIAHFRSKISKYLFLFLKHRHIGSIAAPQPLDLCENMSSVSIPESQTTCLIQTQVSLELTAGQTAAFPMSWSCASSTAVSLAPLRQ